MSIPPLARSSPSPPTAFRSWLGTLLRNGAVLLALAGVVMVGRAVEVPDNALAVDFAVSVGLAITLAVSLQLINGIAGQFSLGHAGFMAVGAYLAGYATLTYGRVLDADDNEFGYANPLAVTGYFAAVLLMLGLAALVVLAVVWIVRLTRRVHRNAPLLATGALMLWAGVDIVQAYETPRPYHLWWHLFGGFNGLFVWTCDAIARPEWIDLIDPGVREPMTLFVSLVGGGLVAAVAGLVVGLPTLRLRGDYLAIATLGFAEIIRVLIVNSPPLGGATGLRLPTYAVQPDPDLGVHQRYILPWVYGLAVITTVLVWRLKYSPKGRALQAIRDDEIAASAVGLDTAHHKLLAFVIGAFFAGSAGAIHAAFWGYLNADQFDFMASVELVVIVTLGGLGSIYGAVIAAVLLTLLPKMLQISDRWLPEGSPPAVLSTVAWIRDQRMIVYALLLIIIMILRTRGWLEPRPLVNRIQLLRKPEVTT